MTISYCNRGPGAGVTVDDEFFTTNPYGCRPEGYPPVEPWTGAVTVDDFRAALRTVTGVTR